jgi:3-methyladenine DNA glycosylase/8-oxoguanine DNA glycosylase
MDDETLIERMVAIKGIGRWTVEMLLMYSLERLDILPIDDFGIREGYRALKSLPEAPKPKDLREIGKAWAPHRRRMVSLARTTGAGQCSPLVRAAAKANLTASAGVQARRATRILPRPLRSGSIHHE